MSTSPSITETLFALGLGDRVVGVSTYCRYPAAVAALPKVGTFLKPDAETIARLKPDLVFVHKGPNNVLAQLGTLGVRTAVVDRGSLPGVFTTIREISAAAHVADAGERSSASSMPGSIASRRRSPANATKDADHRRPPDRNADRHHRRWPGLVPARHRRDRRRIERAGDRRKLEYPRISMETVISLAPDVIVDVGEMGESPADSDRRRQITEGLWRSQTLVEAVRDGGVHAVHDEAFVVPGPRIVEVARTMARWLHGVEAR